MDLVIIRLCGRRDIRHLTGFMRYGNAADVVTAPLDLAGAHTCPDLQSINSD